MELTRIEIENYKSIKSPITISFLEGLPTILIGKNGSGKTNVLEALSAIALANGNYYRNREKEQPTYRAYIQLTEEDVAAMLPDVVYDKNKCEIVACSSGSDLEIKRVCSEYIVPSMKKEITDIRDLASQLKEAVEIYEKQLVQISHDGRRELPINCYKLKDANGRLTNYNHIQCLAEDFIENVYKVLDQMLTAFDVDETTLDFITENFQWRSGPKPFRLEYVEPSLAKFEQKFISINSSAIKQEIEKINKATEDSCERIDRLIKEIEDRTSRIQDSLMEKENSYYIAKNERDKQYECFLSRVKHTIVRKCQFMKNENHDLIFRKEDWDYYYNDHSNSIMETYLRQVYNGSDREELLRSSKNELTLSEQAVADFEAFLNENIPFFDREMYKSISVQAGKKGHIAIFLNEKTGERINLHETSAGRRWYFTYYFMKNILSKGDVFIIDEPAAMLHPSAQREVLCDLMELTKRGIKVVYSTHSPYLIPDEWQCVHFVTMTEEGTEVNCVSSNQELVSQMKQIVGEDIFDISSTIDKYERSDHVAITENVYKLIIATQKERSIKNKQEVCNAIGIKGYDKVATLDSWKPPCKNKISLEYLMKALIWTKKKFEDVLD